METQTNEKPKKRRRTALGIVLILLLILLAALLLPRLGFGTGSGAGDGTGTGDGIGLVRSAPDVDTVPDRSLPEVAEDIPAEVEIRIEGDQIVVNGQTLDSGVELREMLQEQHTDDSRYRLIDVHAVQATYANAKEILDTLRYEYVEGSEG